MAPLDLKTLKIGFIPGTGRMSLAIAGHLGRAGLAILLGSRDLYKAAMAALQLSQNSQFSVVNGLTNEEVAASADLIVWSPRLSTMGSLEERAALLKSLASHLENKIIVDVTNILYFLDESEWGQTSSTLKNQEALGVPARWTTAFKATFARLLEDLPDVKNPHHTLVAGDDEEAVETTIALVDSIPGFKGVKAGALRNSKIIELLGPMWVIELDELNAGGSEASGWRYGK